MVFYLIGLGLGDENDITLKGLQAVKSCSKVFLEAYTSVLSSNSGDDDGDGVNGVVERLEEFYGKKIVVADRNMVESEAEQLYEPALRENVCMLVVGDPVCATTHTDIVLRAKEYGCEVQIIHNTSIMGAAGSCGLQLYNFGQTVSIPFFRENWKPTSFCPKIRYNRLGGMHTLCLLDIKVKEPDFGAMMKGKQNVFLPPRFMTVNQACEQLIEAAALHKESNDNEDDNNDSNGSTGDVGYDPATTLCVGLARLGQPSQKIVAGTLQELAEVDFGRPLHSLIICGDELHELEMEILKESLLEGSNYKLQQQQRQN